MDIPACCKQNLQHHASVAESAVSFRPCKLVAQHSMLDAAKHAAGTSMRTRAFETHPPAAVESL